jgi:hypothetical protein
MPPMRPWIRDKRGREHAVAPTQPKEASMTTQIDSKSRKGKQNRLSDQLKASDLFPPGTGWNRGVGVGSESRHEDSRAGVEAPLERRQH